MKRLILLLIVFCLGIQGVAQEEPSPDLIKSAIMFRILELETTMTSKNGEIDIFVLGAPKLAKTLKQHLGHQIGKARLGRVFFGNELPAQKPDVLFVGISRNLEEILNYTKTNKVMSITDRNDIFQKGVSVSVYTERGRPRIMLNPQASIDEGLNWNLNLSMFKSLILEFKSQD